MDTLTETAAAHLPPVFFPCFNITVKVLAIGATLMFSGVMLAASLTTRPLLCALGPPYITPSNYANLFFLNAQAARPFAIVAVLSSALTALLSNDGRERFFWVAEIVYIHASSSLARSSFGKAAEGIHKMEEEDYELLLIDDGLDDCEGINRHLRGWVRMEIIRALCAVLIGFTALAYATLVF